MPVFNKMVYNGTEYILGGGGNIGEPLNLTVTTIGLDATITWEDNEIGTIPPTTFQKSELVRKIGSAPTSPSDGTLVVTETVKDTYKVSGYVDSGLTDGETYYYRVFSYSDLGGISYCDAVNVTPSAGGWQPGVNTIAYYKFDGNLNDSSGNNNNGTAGGTITYGTNYANLVSGYVTVPNLTYNNTYTLSFWFKCTNLSQGGFIVDGNTSSGMLIRIGNHGSSYFYASTDKPSFSGEKQLLNPADNNWHLFTMTSNASGVTYYLDGTQKATSPAFSGSYTTNGMRIGRDCNGGNNNPGLYAGAFIVESVARTADEISNYYNQTKSLYGIS